MTSKYDREDFLVDNDDDEYLTRVVIDTCARRFYMYSNEGETKDIIGYADPVVAEWPHILFQLSITKRSNKKSGVFLTPFTFLWTDIAPPYTEK